MAAVALARGRSASGAQGASPAFPPAPAPFPTRLLISVTPSGELAAKGGPRAARGLLAFLQPSGQLLSGLAEAVSRQSTCGAPMEALLHYTRPATGRAAGAVSGRSSAEAPVNSERSFAKAPAGKAAQKQPSQQSPRTARKAQHGSDRSISHEQQSADKAGRHQYRRPVLVRGQSSTRASSEPILHCAASLQYRKNRDRVLKAIIHEQKEQLRLICEHIYEVFPSVSRESTDTKQI
jgi:hypothetical protein